LIPNDLKDQPAVFIRNIANAVQELRKEGRKETWRREGEVYKLEERVGQLECQIAKLERQITELESKDKKEDGEEGWTGVVGNGSRTPGGTPGTKIVSSQDDGSASREEGGLGGQGYYLVAQPDEGPGELSEGLEGVQKKVNGFDLKVGGEMNYAERKVMALPPLPRSGRIVYTRLARRFPSGHRIVQWVTIRNAPAITKQAVKCA